MVAALFAALPSRPADRILAITDAVLVVGGAGRRRHRRPRPIAFYPCAVLHRRIRHARRRLHLERHHRPRSRRAGRTDAVAAGIASLVIVAVYPFMKRITWWPQIVLGLAFSWGALMGFAAMLGRIDTAALALYAGSIAWVVGYDTIYAHQDAED